MVEGPACAFPAKSGKLSSPYLNETHFEKISSSLLWTYDGGTFSTLLQSVKNGMFAAGFGDVLGLPIRQKSRYVLEIKFLSNK